MAYFPANSSYPGMLGELYSAAFTAPAFNWVCSPAVTELETIVLNWLARLMKLPMCFLSEGEGGGVIQGSASEAIVTVMVAARERYIRNACDGLEGTAREERVAELRGRLVALGSEMSHSSTAKAALIAGVRYRSIPCHLEHDLALTGKELREVLEECKREKLDPFYLTTTLGTTATCAVDRFDEIREVVKDHGNLWIHVDAAYAGAALICEEYQHLTQHFKGFDSFDVNMHKWLLTNFDASCLYIKQRRDLTSALSVTRSYLQNHLSDAGLVTDYRDWQIPLGRRFRSLKIWFVLRTYGINGLKAHIRKHIKLGEVFHGWVCERPDLFRVPTPPAFALTVLTITPRAKSRHEANGPIVGPTETGVNEGLIKPDVLPSTDDHELDQANEITKEVYELINARGQIFLTSGVVKGIYAIRVVSANEKTEEMYLKRAFDILVQTTEEVLSKER